MINRGRPLAINVRVCMVRPSVCVCGKGDIQALARCIYPSFPRPRCPGRLRHVREYRLNLAELFCNAILPGPTPMTIRIDHLQSRKFLGAIVAEPPAEVAGVLVLWDRAESHVVPLQKLSRDCTGTNWNASPDALANVVDDAVHRVRAEPEHYQLGVAECSKEPDGVGEVGARVVRYLHDDPAKPFDIRRQRCVAVVHSHQGQTSPVKARTSETR